MILLHTENSFLLSLSLFCNLCLLLISVLLYQQSRKPRSKNSLSFFDQFPELNPREIHLVKLILQRASTEAMAAELNIAPDSVKKAKHRLKKKLNIPTSKSLESHLRERVLFFPQKKTN